MIGRGRVIKSSPTVLLVDKRIISTSTARKAKLLRTMGLFCFIVTLLVAPSFTAALFASTPSAYRYRTGFSRQSSVSPLAASAASVPDNGGSDPRQLVRKGMQLFRQGDITGSIELFDRAEALHPSIRPYLWQRGLSYYYANKFQEASDQFRYDVRVNPLDVEEIVWDIASLSKLDPKSVPPPSMLSLPRGREDRRRIMSTVYSLFRGEASEHDLAVAGHQGTAGEEFYALFYLGLYCEACRGETVKAENYMRQAVASSYAKGSGASDYMTSCARVHCQLRGWT